MKNHQKIPEEAKKISANVERFSINTVNTGPHLNI